MFFSVSLPECHAAGGEGGPEEPAEAAGGSKLQPAGSDSRRAAADCVLAGEQHHAADAECQTAGTQHDITDIFS